jgi:hypothetical protein
LAVVTTLAYGQSLTLADPAMPDDGHRHEVPAERLNACTPSGSNGHFDPRVVRQQMRRKPDALAASSLLA